MKKIIIWGMVITIVTVINGCSPLNTNSSAGAVKNIEAQKELRMANYDSGGITIANYDKGYYYIKTREDGSSNIKYINYENASEIYLCNRLECVHDNDTCNSWLPYTSGSHQICLDSDQLYIVHSGANEEQMNKDQQNAQGYIATMDLSGSNKKIIHVFKELQGDVSIGSVAFTRSSIYMIMQKVEMVNNAPETFFYLIEVNKENGNVHELLNLDFNYPNIVGVKDNKIVITNVEEEEGTGFVFSVYSVDVETNNVIKAYSWDNNKCFGRVSNGELYLFNRTTSMVSNVNLETGETTSLVNASKKESIVGIGVIGFVDDFVVGATHNDDGTGQMYMINLKTKSISHPSIMMEAETTDLKGNIMRIVSTYEDKFIVASEIYYDLVSYPLENGQTIKMQKLQYKYGMINKKDYINNINTCTPLEMIE